MPRNKYRTKHISKAYSVMHRWAICDELQTAVKERGCLDY